MKVFRKEADYATRAILSLALRHGDDFVSVTTLARDMGLPLSFLRRICSTLIKGEYLATREGAKGGVRLQRTPKSITLLELIELFGSKPELSECTFRKKLCPNRKTCVLRRRIVRIEDLVAEEFKAITIQTLIDDLQSERRR